MLTTKDHSLSFKQLSYIYEGQVLNVSEDIFLYKQWDVCYTKFCHKRFVSVLAKDYYLYEKSSGKVGSSPTIESIFNVYL